jgi:hypothetical protein
MSSSRPLNRVKSSSSVKSNNSSKLRKTSSKIEIDSSQKSKKNIRLIHNPNNAILKKISDDLSKFDPDKLMLQTNPLLNSTKTIEQIQMYYSGIQKEMNKYQIQEQKKKMLTEKLNDVQNKIDNIVNPQKIISISQIFEEARNFDYNNNNLNFSYNNGSSKLAINENKKENKPIIDYGVKIRVLEKELEYTYQGFNLIKAKNNKLINQLDELRKQNLYHLNKLKESKKVLKKEDDKFVKDKTKVEENLSGKDEEIGFNQLLEKQKMLNEVNKKMTENIKEINMEITQKKAKEKYLNFKKKKLEKKAELIEQLRLSRLENFNNEIKDELDKIKDYKKESEILQNLDQNKLLKLEELLNDIFEETRTENSKQLIDFLAKSCEENSNFKNTVITLQEKVDKLEEEVSELEYIISFCEQHLLVKKANKLGENEIREIKKINNARDLFINLQYKVINDSYRNYINKFTDIIKEFKDNETIKKTDKNNLIIEYTHNIGEKLRKFNEKLKSTGISKDVFDFNKWNHKWDKISRVKEGVINNYMKTFGDGLKFDAKNIEELVDEYLIKEKFNKEKSVNMGIN